MVSIATALRETMAQWQASQGTEEGPASASMFYVAEVRDEQIARWRTQVGPHSLATLKMLAIRALCYRSRCC